MRSCTLFIVGLPLGITTQELTQILAQYGAVFALTITFLQEQSVARIEMLTPEEADRVMVALDLSVLDSRLLSVIKAESLLGREYQRIFNGSA